MESSRGESGGGPPPKPASGLAAWLRFSVCSGFIISVAAAHLAAFVRVHHLSSIEGDPARFHPRVAGDVLRCFVAYLVIVLALSPTMRKSAATTWRRFAWSLGGAFWPLAAMLSWREMTSLIDGAASPGWGVVVLLTLITGVLFQFALGAAEKAAPRGGMARAAFGGPAFLVSATSFFLSANLGFPFFDSFDVALRGMILFGAAAAAVLSALVLRRNSPWWLAGLALLSAMIAGGSLPGAAGAFWTRPGARGRVPEGKPQHVILVTIDTLRADALSVHGGNDAAPTPNMDALARDGVMFANATVSSPWTLPSMAGIHTGEDPRVHLCNAPGRSLPKVFETPAEIFSAAGFHTQAVVHNHFLSEPYGFNQGFGGYTYVEERPGLFETNPLRRSALLRRRIPDSHSTSTWITIEVLRFLKAKGDRPYFLWIHYFDPHKPYLPPDRYLETDARVSEFALPVERTPEEEAERARQFKSRYKGEVRHVDECLGRIFSELKAQGVYDSSLIVLTSDHGEEFFEHGGYTHAHTLYNELLNVPLIWKQPGVPAGGRIAKRVPVSGIRNSLIEAMGFMEPEDDAGAKAPSFLQLVMRGKDDPVSHDPGPIFGGSLDPTLPDARSVIVGEWKLFEWLKTGEKLLFNLKDDPRELKNQAGAEPGRVSELTGLMDAHEIKSGERRKRLVPNPEAAQHDLSEESRNELRNLGYLK